MAQSKYQNFSVTHVSHEINFREFRTCNTCTPLFCQFGLLNFLHLVNFSIFRQIRNLFLIFDFFFSIFRSSPNTKWSSPSAGWTPRTHGHHQGKKFRENVIFREIVIFRENNHFFSCYSPTYEPQRPTPEMALLQNVGGPFNP